MSTRLTISDVNNKLELLRADIKAVSSLPRWLRYTIGAMVLIVILCLYASACNAKKQNELIKSRNAYKDSIHSIQLTLKSLQLKIDSAFIQSQMAVESFKEASKSLSATRKNANNKRIQNEQEAKQNSDAVHSAVTNDELRRARTRIFN